MGLARLAALHGVATSYTPSEGVSVPVPEATVVAVLAALGVDASTPAALKTALAGAEARAAARLLPLTVVLWRTGPDPADGPGGGVSHGGGTFRSDVMSCSDGASHGDGVFRCDGTPHGGGAFRCDGPPHGDAPPHDGGPPGALAALPPGSVVRVTPETGGETTGPDWAALPYGVHLLSVTAPDGRRAESHLVVAPARGPQRPGPGERAHGFLVQLYSLLSERSWGMGDLGDLAELVSWSGRALGAGFAQINPLHSAVPAAPDRPADPSPYRPSSRRFPDPVHLRIEAIPEYAYVAGADRERLAELRRRGAGLRAAVLAGALIDRDAVWRLKGEALELIAKVPLGPGRRADYWDFLAAQGRALDDHATWCALAEIHGPDWHSWPPELQNPRSAATAHARHLFADRVELHCRAAWLTDGQLAAAARAAREAGMAVGVVHDLAVGVHPGGADTWARRDTFATGMSVGAPPDAFNPLGQDWGLPPWRPDALAAEAYTPLRELLRGIFAHAGAVRIDHVMGLFRLWWVPQGGSPTDGTYVHYDAEAMLAVVLLEAHRTGTVVIGEDLGTVEPGVRETLAARGVLGTSVLWFERDWTGGGRPLEPTTWRESCLATATTHDLPSTAARLTGEHVALRHRLGLLTAPLERELTRELAEVQEWLRVFNRLGLLPEGAGDEEGRIRAVHRFLLRTPARMVGIWLPDAVADRRPQNVPGTSDAYPNWRLPIADHADRPVTLEELIASPRLHGLMNLFRPPSRVGVRPGTGGG
ncbi:4-alpha-glucanotransferase [Streptomyces sp. NPDC057638]|uniref:4-alpha-glucanotransferase n=1 Tax=Streptomyces sp. NPDC057638 TaxID=3346190 RepID=UPI003685BA9A